MKLYTKKDIEDIFKISRATVYRWCREGDFPQPINFKKVEDSTGELMK